MTWLSRLGVQTRFRQENNDQIQKSPLNNLQCDSCLYGLTTQSSLHSAARACSTRRRRVKPRLGCLARFGCKLGANLLHVGAGKGRRSARAHEISPRANCAALGAAPLELGREVVVFNLKLYGQMSPPGSTIVLPTSR